MQITVPDKWDNLEIVKRIGEGSYGVVYEAVDSNGIRSAVKIIDIPKTAEEEHMARRELGDEESVKTFYNELVNDYDQEIKLLQSLKDNDNIVEIYDCIKERRGLGWRIYIKMELLDSFVEYCLNNDLGEDRVIQFAVDICSALEACDKSGIIHRDLKPDNILMDSEGRLKLCDFGLARRTNNSLSSYSVKGTFSFMAPEVYFAKPYSKNVDVYSLGLILYKLMNHNREAFAPLDKKFLLARDKENALNRRMNGEALPAPVDASEKFAQIILKACAFRSEDRYAKASDMMADLVSMKEGSLKKERLTYTQKKHVIVATTAVLIIAAGVFTYAWANVFHGIHASLSNGNLKIYGQGTVALEDVIQYRDEATSVEIRNGITGIGQGCFTDFGKISKVTLADSVTDIGEYSFDGCTSLSDINLEGSSVAKIGAGAFSRCESLATVSFPDKVKTVQDNTFERCTSLKRIEWNNVGKLQDGAFMGCTSLEEVTLPDSVKTVPTQCFSECKGLRTVVLGSETTKLETEAFQSCSKLDEVTGLEHVKAIDDEVFTFSGYEEKCTDSDGFFIINDELIAYNGSAATVEIPDKIRVIGSYAFCVNDGKSSVETIIVGPNVETIEEGAFYGSSLKTIEFEDPSKITAIGESAFYDTPWLNDVLFHNGGTAAIGKFIFNSEGSGELAE